jgi:hypothetical protein
MPPAAIGSSISKIPLSCVPAGMIGRVGSE